MTKSRTERNNIVLITLVMALVITVGSILSISASSAVYTVHSLTKNGNSIEESALLGTEYTNFNEALEKMNEVAKETPNVIIRSTTSRSPLKIVAADRALVQSFPYRKANKVTTGKTTLDIYTTAALNSALTYIPAHYNMYYYGTSLTNDRLVANVEINGGKGFVEVDKTDIIPMIYIENEIPVEIGGDQDYSNQYKDSYRMKVQPDYFDVIKEGPYNAIRVNVGRSHPNLRDSSSTYGIAPDWLVPGNRYYSNDGITFYHDIDLKNPVSTKKFYAYFQWLPLRTATNHDAKSFENLLAYYGKHDSVIMGEAHHFVEQGLNYGMNPVLIFSQANLESGYGTSGYAKDRNNLFGWGAVDSNPDNAKGYGNIGEGIAVHMRSQLALYTSVDDFRHYGISFGNKGSGITVKYASDPYYGMKIAALSYTLDRLNGYKDYNAYDLSVLKDSTSYEVKKLASNTSGYWYKTKGNLKNQVIVNYGIDNKLIKTSLYSPNDNTKNQKGYWPMNLFTEFGYISNSNITSIEKYGPTGTKIPTKPSNWTPPSKTVTFDKTSVSAQTIENANFRNSYSDIGTTVIGNIPAKTKIDIYLGSNGWAKVTYNNKTGYLLADTLVVLLEEETPAPEPVLVEAYVNTPGSSLRMRKEANTTSSVLISIPHGTQLKVTREPNKWAKTTYQGYTGYVSEEFLKFDTVKPPEPPIPTYKQGDVNMDGKITTVDVVLVRQDLLGTRKLTDDQLRLSDMNGDGKITTADIVMMRRILLGLQ